MLSTLSKPPARRLASRVARRRGGELGVDFEPLHDPEQSPNHSQIALNKENLAFTQSSLRRFPGHL